MYTFNELLRFGNIDYMLFDVNIVYDERWFHNIFKDAWCESFEEEGDRLSIAYSVASLPG